jgi:hypothetical protein
VSGAFFPDRLIAGARKAIASRFADTLRQSGLRVPILVQVLLTARLAVVVESPRLRRAAPDAENAVAPVL